MTGLYSGRIVQPSRLLEVRHDAEPAHPPGEPGRGSHADHRRQQHERGRQRPTAALHRLERVLQDQRSAVGIADEHERRPGRNSAAHVPYAHPHCRKPISPCRMNQTRRHGAVSRHAQRQRVDTRIAQNLGNSPHAVRRVGQAVNEQRSAANDRRLGLERLFQSLPERCGCDRLP